MMMNMDPIGKITKTYLDPKVWGTERLGRLKQSVVNAKIGESYEVSTFPCRESEVNQRPLSQFLAPSILSYLVKIIDTSQALSIQVHPDDDLAETLEGGSGKDECWLILEAEQRACLYLGLRPGVTSNEFRDAVETGQDVSQLLNPLYPCAGDFYWVPAGTVHALGAGLLLVEVQQNSGVTYRLWDWNRKDENGKGRELHIGKGLQALKESQRPQFKKSTTDHWGRVTLGTHSCFKVELIVSKAKERWKLHSHGQRPLSVIQLEGEAALFGGPDKVSLYQYESAVVLPGESVELNFHKDGHALVVS